MKSTQWIVTLVLICSFCLEVRADEQLQLLSFKTHSRIQIQVDENVPVEWKNSPQGFEIYLKGISLIDLGAPLGEEEKWKEQFEDLKDRRLSSLKLSEDLNGVRIIGKWAYPTGKLALARPVMESFDFRQKSPLPRYVIDFWVKEGPTLVEVENAKKNAELAAIVKKTQEAEKRRLARRLASEKRLAAAENSSQFCEQPLSEKWDVFLEFYPIHEKVDFKKWFPEATPDQDFRYYVPKQKTKDAQYVRLALKFYTQGKYGLAIRTLDFLDSEYPKSDFRLEMKFLRANSMLRLNLPIEAEKILNELMKDAKDSPVAVHSAMYLTGKLLDKNATLAALENFLWLIQHHSRHRIEWVFHLGAAECLYSMMQTERAAKEYKWVMQNAPTRADRAQAVFRLGDIYLRRFQYEQALAAYFQGVNDFKDESKNFPTFYLNRGETFYQLGQYEQAREVYDEFLKLFPTHPGGWRATFRLGEIFGRIAKDHSTWEKSRKWFYETVNHYPFSPGATLARLRLIPCGDHGGFTFESQQRFFAEDAKAFDGGGEVLPKNYHDFRALAEVRALVGLGTEIQTAELAIQDLQTAKNPYVKKTLTLIAHHFFQKVILSFLAEDKKYDALNFYQNKYSQIPYSDDVVEWAYLLKLSQAASDLGLGKMAEEIVLEYQKATSHKKKDSNRLIASVRSEDEESDLEFQLKLSEQNYSQAKSLWIISQNSRDDSEYEKIRELLSKIRDDSKYTFEKELILALMDEREGKFKSALAHVAKAQILSPDLGIEGWLASIEAQVGSPKTALSMYQNLEKKLVLRSKQEKKGSKRERRIDASIGVPALPTLDSIILAQGNILEKQNRWGEAASTYARGVENGWGGAQAQYEYAKTLMKSGGRSNFEKARGVLEKLAKSELKNENEKFWKRLAEETLANEDNKQSIMKTAKEGIK